MILKGLFPPCTSTFRTKFDSNPYTPSTISITYTLDCFHSVLFLFCIEFPVPILIELFSDNIVLAPNISIPIKVIADVRNTLSSSLLSKFSPCLFLFISHAWSRPPIGDAVILREYVATIITRFLLDLQIPAEDIYPWHLMLGGVKLYIGVMLYTLTLLAECKGV